MGLRTTISRKVYRSSFALAALAASLCHTLPAFSSSDNTIRIPPIYGSLDRTAFHRELLLKALNLGLPPSEQIKLDPWGEGPRIGSARTVTMLIQGKYDVIWAPPRLDLEKRALRVNFPFLRGLRGYRIMFVHKESKELLAQSLDKEKLRNLLAGLGIGWTDVAVFNENSLPTITAPTPDDLWRMLEAKRFDYYPRGLTEVLPEWQSRQGRYPSVTIDDAIVIQYPFPLFFYVSRDHPDLHRRLTENLLQLYENGEFQKLWAKKHQKLLRELNFSKRTLIQLKTSHLSSIQGSWPEHILISPEELMRLSQHPEK